MPLEFPWKHNEGYVSPHAYLLINQIVIKAISGEVRVSYLIWENRLAAKVGGETLQRDEVSFPLYMFADKPNFVDYSYELLKNYLTEKFGVEIIKEDFINEQDS
jgi:hypothetical protein